MSDKFNPLHPDTGTPCREIDFSEIFEGPREAVDNDFSGSEREDGNSPAVSDQEEDQIFVSEEVYGKTPPRDVRRQKERAKNLKKTKEKERFLFLPAKNHPPHESSFLSPSSSGKMEQDRKKKRDETLLKTERAAQRKQKMESSYELDGERSNADSSKTPVDVPSIKVEYANRFRSLEFEASQSGKPGGVTCPTHASSTAGFLTPECPEDRQQFYKTFSRLIQLGSKKQKENQLLGSMERQSSAECEQWQVELRQALWLELQAWHADRTMEDQDLHLMEKRADVEAVLDEVINFKVKAFKTDSETKIQECETTLLSVDNSGHIEGLSEKFSNENSEIITPFSEAEIFVPVHSPDVNSHSSCVVNGDLAYELHRQDAVEEETASLVNSNGKELSVKEEQEHSQLPSADKTATDDSIGGENVSQKQDRNLPSRRKVAFTLVTQKQQVTEPQRPCEEQKAAVEQVKALFHQVERVERLYPTLKALGEQNPKYHSEEFNSVMHTLCLWFNLTEDLYHKLHVMAKFLGVNARQTSTWQDWLDMGLEPEDHTQYMSPGGPRRESTSSDSDDSEMEEPHLPPLTPCSPGKNPETPTRPVKRLSAGISRQTSTSRYRPFVDRSIKKMGLSKLGKRIGDIVDTTLMRCKKALSSGISDVFIDKATQKVMQARDSLKKESYHAILSHEQAVRDRIAGIKGHAKRADSRSWSQKFNEIGLPSFRNLYLFVTRITLDISHECLRLRLEHRPKGEPSSLSLLRECKEVINGASLVKDYYVSMVEGILRPEDSEYDSLENSIEDYEEDLREILKIYFEYLHNALHMYQRLPQQASKGLKNHLETEWIFVRQKCRHIRGGEVEGGTRFCVMAAGLLESTGDFLDSGLDHCCSDLHNKTDHRDDLKRKMLEACRGFKHVVNEARERACKALNFIKKLRSDLENAAKFSIDVSRADMLAKLRDTGHVQVVARHTADLLMFVPKHLIEDKREIVHLLNVCCGQEELISQKTSAKETGYLVLMPSADDSDENTKAATWTGSTMLVNPTVDTAISLADVQVGGLMLVVRSSKQLDQQRKLFQTVMTSAVGLERERTSSHQAIAESLNDLKEASLALQDRIVSAIQRVDQNLDLSTDGDLDDGDRHLVQNTYVETMHSCYNFGFEYQREIARLVTGEGHDRLGQTLLAFAQRWMKFVMTRCERGRGTRPRWASQGLDFLTVACSPKTLQLLSEAEFQDLKKEINDCICHVIGSADTSLSNSPVFKPQSPALSPVFGKGVLLRPYSWPGKPPRTPPLRESPESRPSHRTLSDPSNQNGPGLSDDTAKSSIAGEVIEEEGSECGRETLPLRNSCVTAPDGPRLKRMRRKLKEVERRREQKLLDRHAIGRKSHKRRDIASELINITNKKVPFKWQRGIKIGEGQFGKVYACVNLDSGELMAVKQIKFQLNDHGEIKELADEIKNFEGIKHKNLVRYYGMELHRDEMYIFMEYCADGTISDVSKVGLPESMIRQYTFQILVAVSFLHDSGIVHRDIKGPNIFLSSDGFIKLGDFGSSIKLKDPFKTMHGEISNIRGTVAYMAPEVITLDKGAGYGRAADIWSVGCVVVEMATGKPPWPDCDNNWAIMYKVGGEDGKPAIPESLSEEGKDFLVLCFQKDPRERHTANELMDHAFAKV